MTKEQEDLILEASRIIISNKCKDMQVKIVGILKKESKLDEIDKITINEYDRLTNLSKGYK